MNDRLSMLANRIRFASASSRAGDSYIRESESTSPFSSAM